MANRERKRGELRKRKRRTDSSERVDGAAVASPTPSPDQPEESFEERMARRAEERNAAARAELRPLAEGERPRVVTVGAIVSVVIALVFTASAVIALTGLIEIRDDEPTPLPLALVAAVSWLMAWGMWKARYWAVLGFQMLLLLVILSSALGLVRVSTVPEVVATLSLLAAASTLFYFMIRAMARIQMPERPGS